MARLLGLLLPLVLSVPSLEAGFAPPVNHGAGNYAHSVVVGDWNRDGEQDVAVANVGGNDISILLADGSGSFLAAVNYAAGLAPFAMTAGDFNRDAIPDLAVANRFSNSVSVHIGNGNGTFQAAAFLLAGNDPFAIGVGDFDGDGAQDIVTPNIVSDNIYVFRGNGDGSFQGAVSYAAGRAPYSVVVADFNQDGKQDLATSNQYNDVVSIFLGPGNGTFPARVTFPAGTNPLFMTHGDLNQDGRQDLIALNGLANLSVLLGNGDGTFQAPLAMFLEGNPAAEHAVVDDFDADGLPDLAIAGTNLRFLRGKGDGTFHTAVVYSAPGTPSRSVAVGDFDRDGRRDLAVANGDSNNVSILLNDAAATECTLQGAVNYPVSNGPYAVTVGDWNRDGVRDLAVPNSFSNTVSVLLGYTNGTFQAAVPYAVGSGPRSITVGDWNRDGRLDLAVPNVNSDNVSLLFGNGDGTFQAQTTFAVGDSPTAVATGDFDRDGISDLAVVNNALSNTVSIMRGLGDGSFVSAGTPGVGAIPQGIAVGDFNRDGREDLAVANNFSNNVSILLGNGNATFQGAVNYAAHLPRAVVVGDFDRDGKQDLAVPTYDNNAVAVLRGNGDGTFQAGIEYAAGTNTVGSAVSDLNLDGIPDLAVANGGSANLSVLLGDGTAAFQAPLNYALGTLPIFIAPSDFNRDGKPDLAAAINATNTVSILVNTCRYVTTTTLVSSQNPAPPGQMVTFTATVASGGGDHGIPSGTVTFKDGAVVLATENLSNGTATFSTSVLSLAVHPITAEYSGDASFVPSVSPVLVQVVVPAGQAAVSTSDASILEGVGGAATAWFTVSLSNPSTFTVTVPYSTADSSASAGVDYATASGVLTFLPGETSQTVGITVFGDLAAEGNETFFLNLGAPSNSILGDGQGVGTIVNDDPPGPSSFADFLMLGQVRPTDVSVATPTRWFKVRLVAGRSYAASTWAPGTDESESPVGLELAWFLDDGATAASGTSAGAFEPLPDAVAHVGAATSIIPTPAQCSVAVGCTYRVRLQATGATATIPVSLMVVESTLLSPYWQVVAAAGYDAAPQVRNNASTAVPAVFTAYSSAGLAICTQAFTVPAHGLITFGLSGSVPGCGISSGFGSAQIAHQGPPGSLTANITTFSSLSGLSFDAPFRLRNTWTSLKAN